MKAAIYIRVSTDKIEQETSLVSQRLIFENYAKEHDLDIYNVYEDVESGTTDRRIEFQQLISDAKSKKFDIILAKELSRLARNQALSLQLKDILDNRGIHLVTLDGAINTLESRTDNFGLYAWLYEQESQRISKRVKTSLKQRALKGLYKGSNAPYGYIVKERKLYVSKDGTADIVKRIYREYLEGIGFDAIARGLYHENIPTPAQVSNKKNASEYWHGSTVRLILENPHYTGCLVQQRTSTISATNKNRQKLDTNEWVRVQDTHEPIIAQEEFDVVQQLIKSRRKTQIENPQKYSQVHQNIHLFTGILVCEQCESSFHYKRNRKGYVCGKYNKHGKKACTDHHILEEELIMAIRKDLKSLLAMIDDKKYLKSIETKIKKQQGKLEVELRNCENKILRIKDLKKMALTKFLDEDISKEDYHEYIEIQDKSLSRLELHRGALLESNNLDIEKTLVEQINLVSKQVVDFEEIDRNLINRLIKKIVIKEDGRVDIYYRFANPYNLLKK